MVAPGSKMVLRLCVCVGGDPGLKNEIYLKIFVSRTVMLRCLNLGFIAYSSSCTTTELSKLLTFCLTTIKKHVIKYCEKVYEWSGKNLFWSIKKSCEVLNKLKSRASSLSTYDFSTLYTTLPHNLIKDKLVDSIERTLFCYERGFMLSLSEDNQSDVIEAFNSTSRYLDDLLNIDNNFFDSMDNRIYPSELQLNKANVSDTEASFLNLHLSISNGFVKTKIYDKRDDFDFDIVNFSFLDGDVPRLTSYGVYISQLIRFARVSSHVDDFNTRNKVLTANFLDKDIDIIKFVRRFQNFIGGIFT